jgi:hypothetical protein
MQEIDSKLLFRRLETFEKHQFIWLRNELDLSSSQVPFADTPQVTADRFINVIRQRDDDLRELKRAVDTVLGRKPAGGEAGAERRPAEQEEIEGELDLEHNSRPPPRSAKDLPRLYVLCDRDDPVDAIKSAIGSSAGALVFLIVGYDDQSHDFLVQRLCDFELRDQAARSDGGQVPYRWINMPGYQSVEQFKHDVEFKIRGNDLARANCDLRSLANKIYRTGPVTLFESEMSVGDWRANGPEKLAAFLEFWKTWPPPMGQECIVVCLSVKIDRQTRLEKLKYKFLKSPVFKRINQFVTNDQRLLPANRMFVIEGVTPEHAVRWRRSEHVKSVLERLSSNSNVQEDKLRELHKRAGQWWDPLPTMKRFAGELEALIAEILDGPGRGRTPA